MEGQGRLLEPPLGKAFGPMEILGGEGLLKPAAQDTRLGEVAMGSLRRQGQQAIHLALGGQQVLPAQLLLLATPGQVGKTQLTPNEVVQQGGCG